MLHTKSEASKPSGSEEEDFGFFFLCTSVNLTPEILV